MSNIKQSKIHTTTAITVSELTNSDTKQKAENKCVRALAASDTDIVQNSANGEMSTEIH